MSFLNSQVNPPLILPLRPLTPQHATQSNGQQPLLTRLKAPKSAPPCP